MSQKQLTAAMYVVRSCGKRKSAVVSCTEQPTTAQKQPTTCPTRGTCPTFWVHFLKIRFTSKGHGSYFLGAFFENTFYRQGARVLLLGCIPFWSKNDPKIKVLRMGWPIVENVPTSCGIMFNLFRGP